MANVYRIFVEKKKGNDIEAMQILTDLRQNVGITALTGLRLINRYDVQGVSEAEFRRAVHGVFAEDNLDNTADEVTFAPGERVFAMEFLPGQYDQRADSAAQCIQLLTAGECPRVASAKVIALAGDITDAEFDKIKSYLINPVESREATMAKPESLDLTADVPADIARIAGFIAESDDEIAAYHSQMGFAMSVEDLKWVRDYFKNEEHRDPSLTELKVIDTYWSDHCRHTKQIRRRSRGRPASVPGYARRPVCRQKQRHLPDGYGLHRHQISEVTGQGGQPGRERGDQRLLH